MRALSVDPVADTRETFRALVDATSRPGAVERTPVAPAHHAVAATLVDHEVTIRGGDERLRAALDRESRRSDAAFEEADVVFVDGDTDGRVVDAKRGSLKEPSDGATVVYRVDDLVAPDDLSASDEPTDCVDTTDESTDVLVLSLSGPGVPGSRRVGVRGLPAAEVDAIAEAQSTYPRGVDVYLTAADRLVSLPRSVDVDVEVA
ncbi:phosphonate C-P lyase system protein PhnH [Halomicrococcus gelatinilyticus]|uniref:phosphonate C-P lyase system protein PhnH n=1 Tax=Halomicrococcus gelatinilyticus TaxID=1702103 RepID=UPI002E0F9025